MSDRVWFFLSDLHLSDATPKTLEAFERFLATISDENANIVVLGDLFEAWVGDDDQSTTIDRVKTAFIAAKHCGSRVFLMHGNRDFLIGEPFADECELELLPDPYIVDLFGTDTLLTHGDVLCTDDTAYQAFRRQSRAEQWQADFLSLPLAQRKQIAGGLRNDSEQAKKSKSMDIMDVNTTAVEQTFDGRWPDRTYLGPLTRIIHGHTHRPAEHQYKSASRGNDGVRYVLPDWDFEQTPARGGYIKVSAEGVEQHLFGRQGQAEDF